MWTSITAGLAAVAKLALNIFYKTPEQKERDRIKEMNKDRAKRLKEKNDAQKKFKKGDTNPFNRLIRKLFK